jgi:hypothetical protein
MDSRIATIPRNSSGVSFVLARGKSLVGWTITDNAPGRGIREKSAGADKNLIVPVN